MEDFVNYEIANKLKNLGFEESTYHYYNIDDIRYCRDDYPSDHNGDPLREFEISAPTISQVLKWLREEKRLHIAIDIWGRTWGYDIIELTSGNSLHWTAYREDIKSYEDAALDGIEYILDNLDNLI